MAAFVLAMIVNDYKNGQVSQRLTHTKICIDNLKALVLFLKILPKKTTLLSNQIVINFIYWHYIWIINYMGFIWLQDAALQGNVIATCLEQLSDPSPSLRQWLALCLGKVYTYILYIISFKEKMEKKSWRHPLIFKS